MRVALPGAVAGALLLNWFFTPPYGTLRVESAEQVVVLAVYLGVAVAVSWVVDLAARRTAEAARARAEAEALSGLAGAALAEQRTLTDLLAQVRQVFGMREAALLERDGRRMGRRRGQRRAATSGADEHELRVPAGADLALRVRGPGAVRRRPAGAGQLRRGRRRRPARAAGWPSGPPRRRSWRPPTGCAPPCSPASGHDLRTPLAARQGRREQPAAGRRRLDRGGDRGAAGHHRGRRRPAAAAGGQPARRLPAAGRRGQHRARAGPAWRSWSAGRCSTWASLDAVDLDIPEDLPDVLADVGLAERVLANVLENALRHGGAGTRHRPRRAGAGTGTVVCDVDRPRTGRARRAGGRPVRPVRPAGGDAGASATAAPGGLGLGLAVARGFAEAMSGEPDRARRRPAAG